MYYLPQNTLSGKYLKGDPFYTQYELTHEKCTSIMNAWLE